MVFAEGSYRTAGCQGNVDIWQNINGITSHSIPDLGFKVDELISSPGRLQDNCNRKENNNGKVKKKSTKKPDWETSAVCHELRQLFHHPDSRLVQNIFWLALHRYITSESIWGSGSSQNCRTAFGSCTSTAAWQQGLDREASWPGHSQGFSATSAPHNPGRRVTADITQTFSISSHSAEVTSVSLQWLHHVQDRANNSLCPGKIQPSCALTARSAFTNYFPLKGQIICN